MIKFQLIKTQKEYIYRGKNHTFIYTKLGSKHYLSAFNKELKYAEDRTRYFIGSYQFKNFKEILAFCKKDNIGKGIIKIKRS